MENKTQLQTLFLLETIFHYTSNNSGVEPDGETCSYTGGCAIGRKIPFDLRVELDKGVGFEGLKGVGNGNVFNKLPAEMQVLECEFLGDVQKLHDILHNWCETGLSDKGRKSTKDIIRNYNLNF